MRAGHPRAAGKLTPYCAIETIKLALAAARFAIFYRGFAQFRCRLIAPRGADAIAWITGIGLARQEDGARAHHWPF
jgi:hypothetical protein